MRFTYLWPAVAWSLIILIITLLPGETLPEVGIFQIDKVVHFFVFAILMFLTAFGLKRGVGAENVSISIVLWAAVYSLVLGVLVEIFQIFVPNRSFSLVDIVAN